MSILVGDIETNGLKPSLIWMVGIVDVETNEYTSYIGDDEVPIGLLRLAEADLVIGHYFKGYDAPQIERLTEGLVKFDYNRIIDTVELSRKLFPEMPNHKLETWGEILGFPKLHFKNFDTFDPAMIPYLQRDCELNKVLYDFFMDYMASEP